MTLPYSPPIFCTLLFRNYIKPVQLLGSLKYCYSKRKKYISDIVTKKKKQKNVDPEYSINSQKCIIVKRWHTFSPKQYNFFYIVTSAGVKTDITQCYRKEKPGI